jgi:mRNA-degrading endonuclease RelE of RelBE toxin-antitoxin system
VNGTRRRTCLRSIAASLRSPALSLRHVGTRISLSDTCLLLVSRRSSTTERRLRKVRHWRILDELGSWGGVVIVETPTFTRLIREVLDEESYRLLQLELAADPGKGVLIPGTGGVRKLRWAASGRGRSGGARVIYYWAKSREVVLMLAVYAKNDQVNLTPAQSKLLRSLVEKEFG